MQNRKHPNDLAAGPENSTGDLAKLFDYPSVGELFSDSTTRRFDEFCSKLTATRESLERIVRYGTSDEAKRAARAARAVEVTLEFLQNLKRMRQNSQK
jgi:hypothetical protein